MKVFIFGDRKLLQSQRWGDRIMLQLPFYYLRQDWENDIPQHAVSKTFWYHGFDGLYHYFNICIIIYEMFQNSFWIREDPGKSDPNIEDIVTLHSKPGQYTGSVNSKPLRTRVPNTSLFCLSQHGRLRPQACPPRITKRMLHSQFHVITQNKSEREK